MSGTVQRVFVSYTHQDDVHNRAVLGLVQELRRLGVDAVIDRFFPAPEQGWPQWMDDEIDRADYVLLVCSKLYHDRATGRAPGEGGLGGRWEGLILRQAHYEALGRNEKFIPVVFGASEIPNIPQRLRGFTYFILPDGFEDLYRLLTSQPSISPEPVGPVRILRSGSDLAPMEEVSLNLASPVAGTGAATRLESPTWTPFESVDEIERWIGDCRRCSLAPTRERVVFGWGNPNADLLVVGEAPGSTDESASQPLSGPAGQLMNRVLSSMFGLTRDDVFLVTTVLCRPPRNRSPSKDCLLYTSPSPRDS